MSTNQLTPLLKAAVNTIITSAVNLSPTTDKHKEYYDIIHNDSNAYDFMMDSIRGLDGDVRDLATRWIHDLHTITYSSIDDVPPPVDNSRLFDAEDYSDLLARYGSSVNTLLLSIRDAQAQSLDEFQTKIANLSDLYQNIVNTGVKVGELQSNTELVTTDRSTVEYKALLLMIKVCNAMHVGKAIRVHYSAEPEACKLILELASKIGKGDDISHHANKGRTIIK